MTSPNPDPERLDPALRFDAIPYQADGGYSLGGFGLTILLSVVGGLAAGFLASWIGQWVYLIVLFPLATGLVAGLFGALGARLGKLRNCPLAILAGLGAGCLALVTMHYFDYRRFLADADKNVPGAVDMLQFSLRGFAHFIDQSAVAGVEIMGRGGQRATNLGYYGSYIYWIVEVVLAAATAGVVIRAIAAMPFCSECRTWKTTRPLGRVNVPRQLALEAITSGEIIRLAGHDVGPGSGLLNLEVAVCPNCGAEVPVDIKFKEVTINKKGEEKLVDLAHVTYPGEALRVLESLFEAGDPGTAKTEAAATPRPSPQSTTDVLDQIALKPADKKRKKETWHLSLGEEEAQLIAADNQVLATIRRSEAKARFVFPSFWDSVRNLGILGDDGKVCWFQPDKAGIKKIKNYMRG